MLTNDSKTEKNILFVFNYFYLSSNKKLPIQQANMKVYSVNYNKIHLIQTISTYEKRIETVFRIFLCNIEYEDSILHTNIKYSHNSVPLSSMNNQQSSLVTK